MVVHVDQKLKKQTGIICDLCAAVFTDKFEYYSAKFDLVEVDRSIGKTGIKHIDRQNLDLDICIGCMEKMKATVVSNIKRREEDGVWSTSVEPPKPENKPKPSTPRHMGAVAQKIQQPPAPQEKKPEPEVKKGFEFVAISVVANPEKGCELKKPEPATKKPDLGKVEFVPAHPDDRVPYCKKELPLEEELVPKPPTPPKLMPRLPRPQNLTRPDLPPGPSAPVIKKPQEPPK